MSLLPGSPRSLALAGLLALAPILSLAPAAMAEVTLTVANNSSDSIATVSIHALTETGQPADAVLGTLGAPVAPGTSATIAVELAECGPAFMRASYGDGTPIDGTVDLCTTPTIDFND